MSFKKKKAQSANELLVVFMFAFFIFVLFLTIFARQRSEEVLQAKIAIADQIGSQFADEINLAARGGDGYVKKFLYPEKLEGVTPYTIILNTLSNSIDINFSRGTLNFSHSFPLVINTASETRVSPRKKTYLPDGREYGYVIFSTDSTPEPISRNYIYIQNVRGIIIINHDAPSASIPTSISIDASPTEIPADMISTSSISVEVLDQWELPVKDGVPIHFSTTMGSIQEISTTKDGIAVAILTSGLEIGTANITVDVSSMNGSTYVDFAPPTLIGDYTWLHRKRITIDNTQNPNTLTDYQIYVPLDMYEIFPGISTSDCRDIRFTDTASYDSRDWQRNYSFWWQVNVPGTSWTYCGDSYGPGFYVKVDQIPPNSIKTIYIYYGNPSASFVINENTTFLFFDEFVDNRSKWIAKSGTAKLEKLYGSYDTLHFTGSNCQYVVETAKTISTPAVLEASWSFETAVGTGNAGFDFPMVTSALGSDDCSATSGDWYLYAPLSNSKTRARLLRHSGTTYTTLVDIPWSPYPINYGYWKLVRNGTYTAFYNGDSKIFESTDSVSISQGPGYIAWRGGNIYIRNIKVRKYTYPEPTVTIG